jgi:murein DD-endopeptidase MepM/ murein hydrolase activator NlpD
MEFQFHPASRRGAVRSLVLADRGEKWTVALAAAAALFALSLWITVPTAVARALRREGSDALERERAASERESRELAARIEGLRRRALDAGDLLSRVAFLYRVPPARWPRRLNSETGTLAAPAPHALVDGLDRYVAALERGLLLLEAREAADPTLAQESPSLLPLSGDLVEPSALFGPRVSPWTGAEEFFIGLDLAAPSGTPVIAPADGTVSFVGRVPASSRPRLWRFGNLVILSHGAHGVTLFGHLGKIDVRRGGRVRRGQRLGTVGATGWAMSPALHYEYWRERGGTLSPTDPRFGILDRRFAGFDVSLERMEATSAPGPVEPLPGK